MVTPLPSSPGADADASRGSGRSPTPTIALQAAKAFTQRRTASA
jgi:hypothetical protein